jgi:hypothetical protein
MSGFGPLASYPLAAQPRTAVATTLTVSAGAFTLSGIAANFVVRQLQGVGAFAQSGNSINLLQSLERGPFTFNGNVAALSPTVLASAAPFVTTGFAASYDLKIDPGGLGGAIVAHRAGDEHRAGPVFTRARYHAVLADAEAARATEQRQRDNAARRARELKDAADAAARAAIRTRWLTEDALAADAADERALAGGLSALSGARSTRTHARELADIAARQAQDAKDDEAIALLLLAS